jgi:hypothetical protein
MTEWIEKAVGGSGRGPFGAVPQKLNEGNNKNHETIEDSRCPDRDYHAPPPKKI